MSQGKQTCKILKEIRQQIADKNIIEYVTDECDFQGECKGTCPKCEAELRHLENELSKRKHLGKAVAIAGISLGIAGSFANCNSQKQDNQQISEQEITADTINIDTINDIDILQGEFVPPVPDFILDGIIGNTDAVDKNKIIPVSGDVEYLSGEVVLEDTIEGEPFFIVVEEMPEYVGGEEERLKFLVNNIVYPKTVRNLPEGKVVVSFIVEPDGSLTNFEITRSLYPMLDEEVLRVAKLMPKFKAGKQKGKAVRVKYQMPITFTNEK